MLYKYITNKLKIEITLDDKEYDTDTFSKEALASLNSLQFVRSELAKLTASIATASARIILLSVSSTKG